MTSHLDADSFAALDGLRGRHFPPHLNRVPAHISLFHHLPGDEVPAVLATVAACCADMTCLDLTPSGVRFLGRGVALGYQSAALSGLHARLAAAWRPWLTAQDRQPFRAHVTIQNKVEPAVARSLHEALLVLPPVPCRVIGLTIWRYLGGPWERVRTQPFRDAS